MKLLLTLIVLLASGMSHAHTRSYSYSLWEMDSASGRVTVRMNQVDLTRLQLHPDYTPDYSRRIAELAVSNLQLSTGEGSCNLRPGDVRPAGDGWVIFRADVSCPSAELQTLSSRLLLDAISSHMHFVTVKHAEGQVAEKVLTEADNRWRFAPADRHEPPGTLASYWLLGVEHILTGWDHLAFVFGLLLLAASISQLAWLVTGFTLAHSITLALAALGQLQPMTTAVEALIGLSILLVAVENVWEQNGRNRNWPLFVCAGLLGLALLQPAGVPVVALLGIALFVACYFAVLGATPHVSRWRLLIAFAFGLFHGFGFAGILAEMSLPESRLVAALFGFNIGVETGQLAVVAVLWPLLRGLGRWPAMGVAVQRLGTTAIAGLGTFWFITRAFA